MFTLPLADMMLSVQWLTCYHPCIAFMPHLTEICINFKNLFPYKSPDLSAKKLHNLTAANSVTAKSKIFS